jgi:hypothetical protein
MRSMGGALIAVVSAAGSATAEGAPAIEYRAPGSCPDADAFLTLVEARAGTRWPSPSARDRPRFAVLIQDGPMGTIGRLRRMDTTSSATREVTGRHCREVVEALALTTALSLTEAIAEAEESTRTPPAAGLRTGPITKRDDPAVRAPPQWAVGLGLGAWVLLPPRPMPVAALSLDYLSGAWPARFTLARPDLRLTAFHGRNHLLRDQVRAGFELSGAALEVCPAGASGPGLHVRLCATGQLGVLSGFGVEVAQPRTARSAWVAAGLLGRLGVRASQRVMVLIDAGALVPLRRTDFVFDGPRVEVASVPAVVPQLGVTVALTIP